MAKNENPTPWRSDTQNYLLTKWFMDHPWEMISPGQALDMFGTMKLATRVSEIKKGLFEKCGVVLEIKSKFCDGVLNPRTKFKKYWIDDENRKKLQRLFMKQFNAY